MQLTSELFAQLLRTGNSGPEAALANDRRRTPRTPLELDAMLMPFSDRFAAENIEVPVRDISRGGFSFIHDGHLPLGEQFALLLPETSGRPLAVLCTIAWWQPLESGLNAIGATFSRVLREGLSGLPILLENEPPDPINDARAAS